MNVFWPKRQLGGCGRYFVALEAYDQPIEPERLIAGYTLPVSRDDGAEDELVSGIFATDFKTGVLFTDQVELRLADLPRWVPTIDLPPFQFDDE